VVLLKEMKMNWKELTEQIKEFDNEEVWKADIKHERELLQAFADELVRKMQGTILTRAGMFVLKGKIHELLTEAGVER